MRDEFIHMGDVLRVREWEDMEAEFGLDEMGDITPDIEWLSEDFRPLMSHESFLKEMRSLCGHTFTVLNICKYETLINDYTAEELEFSGWTIEAWMLEPIGSDEEIEPEEPDTLIGFLLL